MMITTVLALGLVLQNDPKVEGASHHSAKLKYSVRFPGTPTVSLVKRGKIDVEQVSLKQNGRQYVTSVAQTKRADEAAMNLGETIDSIMGVASGVEGRGQSLSARDVKTGEIRGKEYVIKPVGSSYPTGSITKIRVYATGRRVCMIGYCVVDGKADVNAGDSFLDSFEILDPEPLTPGSPPLPKSWKRAGSSDSVATALLPTPPQLLKNRVKTPLGSFPVETNYAKAGFGTFIVQVTELPKTLTKQQLATATSELSELDLAVNSGKLLSESGKLDSMTTGHDVVISTTNMVKGREVIITSHRVLRGTKVYEARTITTAGYEYQPFIDAFLQSFEIKD